jgi:hypothetical protein
VKNQKLIGVRLPDELQRRKIEVKDEKEAKRRKRVGVRPELSRD